MSNSPTDKVNRVIAYIDRCIGNNDLRPGDPVRELLIMRALDIGRVPVREAIRILAGEGVLTLTPQRGAKVSHLNPRDVIERVELISWASAAAIERLVQYGGHTALKKQLTTLGKAVVMHGRTGDGINTFRAIGRFHGLIIERCGSTYLRSVVARARVMHYMRVVIELVGDEGISAQAINYPRIAKAISAGEADTAVALLLTLTRKMLLDYRTIHP